MHRIAVTALGNPDRGDDAVGVLVAEALHKLLPEDVPVFVHSGDALSLLDHWSGCDAVVCIDAAAPMGSPGRVHRLDLSIDALPPEGTGVSSHSLGLREGIALARVLRLMPRKVIVYAIEGCCFDAGAAPTPRVAAAAASTAQEVASDVARLRPIP